MCLRVKIIKFALTGFLLGMVMGNLIAWLVRAPGTVFVSPALVARTGSTARAILVQTLVSGLYGAFVLCGVLVYEIDHWPLVKATAVHYLIVAAPYAAAALFLGWADGMEDLLPVEGLMFASYFLIWLVMWLRCKAQVRKLNELLKKTNDRKEISQ